MCIRDSTKYNKTEEEKRELLREKVRAELLGFVVSALPIFAANTPPQLRDAIITSFADRFENVMESRFTEAMAQLDLAHEDPEETLKGFMLWSSCLFSDLGIRAKATIEDHEGHLEFLSCPWLECAKENPVFCMICRTMVVRSSTWIAPGSSARMLSCISDGSETCSFRLHMPPKARSQ